VESTLEENLGKSGIVFEKEIQEHEYNTGNHIEHEKEQICRVNILKDMKT